MSSRITINGHSIFVEASSIVARDGILYIDGLPIQGLTGVVRVSWEVDLAANRSVNSSNGSAVRGHVGDVGSGAVGHVGDVTAIAVGGDAIVIGHAGDTNVAAVGGDALAVGFAGDINVAAVGGNALAVGFAGNINVVAKGGRITRIGHGNISVAGVAENAVVGHGDIHVTIAADAEHNREQLSPTEIKGELPPFD